MTNVAWDWPLLPNGKEVPIHRRSLAAYSMGKPVFCASSWRKIEQGSAIVGEWRCGYCTKWSTDPKSPTSPNVVTQCTRCWHWNRISL